MDKIKEIDKWINQALIEDFNELGDITTDAIFPVPFSNQKDTYVLKAKDSGILCGKEIFCRVFLQIDPELEILFFKEDGENLSYGTLVAQISGKTSSILKGERTALNFLSHLSGIATKSAQFAAIAGKTKILDTRKTIPGWRNLAKYAVACGGCYNHRLGLFDMVMIKDNHIDAAGSITKAVTKVRNKWGTRFKIEVEARNLAEVEEALSLKVDRIMLDNMDTPTMIQAIALINHKVETEASGNMSLERILEIREIGLDYISVGELTHTVKAFDFSLTSNKSLVTS